MGAYKPEYPELDGRPDGGRKRSWVRGVVVKGPRGADSL